MTQISKSATGRERGWTHIVNQIVGATEQSSFLHCVLQAQCNIVAADYGALWLVDNQNNIKLAQTWPTRLDDQTPDSGVVEMLKQAAGTGLQKASSQVLKLQLDGDSQDAPQNAPTHSLVFVTMMRSGGRIAAISTAVAQCHDEKVVRATEAMRELAAGLYEIYPAKHEAQIHRNDAQCVRRAMATMAVSQEGRGFNGACMNLVNELARQHKCTRVSIGWIKGQMVRIVSMSDTEHLKRHDEQVTLVELAMAECLDQQQPIVQPLPESSEPLLAHAVVHAHRRLTDDHPTKHALSIPLRHGDEWIGVLLLERTGDAFDEQLIQQLQLAADVIAPHLADRRRVDRFLVGHAWNSFTNIAGYLVGPKHVGWKLLGVAVAAVLVFAAIGTWPYHVSASFVLEAQAKRVIPAPYQGRLDHVSIEPGVIVQSGDVLAQLATIELKLQLDEATSQLKRTTYERTQAIAKNEQAEAQQALATIEQTRSRIKLLQYQIDQATIRAPINGVVLSGYWHDKVGGVMEIGQTMFEVAPLEELVAIVRVDESDIDMIDTQSLQSGQLATRSVPEEKFTIHVNRVVPLATPEEGTNAFEVRCRIDDPAPWLRPGMEGLARIEIGDRRIAWIATHRIINYVRLWLWL